MLPVPQNIAESHFVVVFENEDSIRKTVATATAEQKSFLQKMVDYLKDFIKSIKKLIDLYGDSDKTVRAAVMTPTEHLQYIADTFEAVLQQTAEIKKPTTETGGVKASLSVVGLEEYNKESKNNIKMRGGLIINSVAELRSYVAEALNGKTKKNLHLGAIPKKLLIRLRKILMQIYSKISNIHLLYLMMT